MSFFETLLPAVEHVGMWGYWIMFALSFFESLVVIGEFVPGLLSNMLFGFLASRGFFDIGDLIFFSSIGAFLGDWLSYYLGTKGTHLFRKENVILKAAHLAPAEAFFEKHGGKSVLLARFMGPLRPVIPFVAGLFKMKKKNFLFWNGVSALLWSVVYLLLGFFFGSAIGMIQTWSVRLGYLIFCGVVLYLIWYMRNVMKSSFKSAIRFFSTIISSVVKAINIMLPPKTK